MNWMSFFTQLLQTISVGTIATALYASAKALRGVLNRKPLLFATVRQEGANWHRLEMTIRNRCPAELYIEAIELIRAERAMFQVLDGRDGARADIAMSIGPYVPPAADVPTAHITGRIHDLDGSKPPVIEATVIYSRRWFPRRRYRFAAIVASQRQSLSIRI